MIIVDFYTRNKWTIIPFQPDNLLVTQLPTSLSLNSIFVFFPQKIFRRKKFFSTVFLIQIFQSSLLVNICQRLGFFEIFSLVLCCQINFFFFFTAHIRNDDEKVSVVGYPNKDRHGDLHDQPCIISLVFEYEMDRQHPGNTGV